MVEFRLFGVPVQVQPSHWLTLGMLGFFSTKSVESSQVFMLIALFMLAGFISILVHEMGHALVLRLFKQPVQVILQSFGGVAIHPAGMLNRWQNFMVSAAGPALQLVFGCLFLVTAHFVNYPDTLIQYFIHYLILVSIFWAILNCIPVYPLDGGQMLYSILGPKRKKLVHMIGVVIAALVAVWSLSKGQMFLLIFMAMFAWQNYKEMQNST